ncbi:hypothetical protein L1049_018179 [Liquidambar formosana]|uniref:Uncharacterized protein n=1 Tax=Liquidambar formosana TaxID=63359 RepID=A0AAP0NNC5_LIQFO
MEAELILTAQILLSVVLGGLLVVLVYVYNLLVLKPNGLRSKLRRQGIRGPFPSFLLGNIPEMKRIQAQTNIHVLNWKHAAIICNRSRDGEGNEPLHFLGSRKAFIFTRGPRATAGPGPYIFKWPNLGPPKKNHCS